MNISSVVEKMTLEDKIALCSGASFWKTKAYEKYGIPSIFMSDGPHGLRKQDVNGASDMLAINQSRVATCFPAEVTTASSWDPELLKEIGQAIGREALSEKISLVLGPGVNIKRSPLCGRNFEYFSEDPYLSGKLAAGFIKGIQSVGVGSSLKHFAANSQEKSRFNSDSIMDERTLREIYLTAFEIAVKESKPATVMCAYPKLNGVHCSDNKYLLTDILREEWGFEGIVVSDWGAVNNRIEAFRAGCDLNMPGGSNYMEKEVLKAVQDGKLSEKYIDKRVTRILKFVYKATQCLENNYECDYDANHNLAKRAVCESAVLLKNDDKILPLKKDEKTAVIGYMAKQMRFQGSGSSHINPIKLSQPLDFLPNTAYADGYDVNGETNEELIQKAVQAAKEAKTAVVFAGLPDSYEYESFDRSDMKMPDGHLRLIEAVSNSNKNTVVVLMCGAPVECPWSEKVKAVLYVGLPGQAGGEAISDLLYGRVNPCGKLAESWPKKYDDCVCSSYYAKEKDALYLEGIYVGYRYYDKVKKDLRWAFGHGLSYTTFSYDNLISQQDKISVNVTNTGDCAGSESEVVKLFIKSPQNGIHRPLRELKHFCKIFLQPGETKTVSFSLTERDFAVWHNGWKVPSGTYRVCIENLSVEIEKIGEDLSSAKTDSWYNDCIGTPAQKDLENAMGKPYVPSIQKKGSFSMDNTVEEMKDSSIVMRIIYKVIEKVIAKSLGLKRGCNSNSDFRMMMASSVGSPLRSMMIFGGLKGGLIPGLLEIANGHCFRGISKIIKRNI